jgi:hypothetical protein
MPELADEPDDTDDEPSEGATGVAAPEPLVEVEVELEWPGRAWLRYTPATATAATDAAAMPLVMVRPRSRPASRCCRAAYDGSWRPLEFLCPVLAMDPGYEGNLTPR